MTYEQIIKALERCITPVPLRCNKCAYLGNYFSCRSTDLKKDVLDLIKRQQADIERLKAEIVIRDKIIDERGKEVFRHDNAIRSLHKQLDNLKSEAIKEFAERLKSEYEDEKQGRYINWLMNDIIDNLVKEMTEVNENENQN